MFCCRYDLSRILWMVQSHSQRFVRGNLEDDVRSMLDTLIQKKVRPAMANAVCCACTAITFARKPKVNGPFLRARGCHNGAMLLRGPTGLPCECGRDHLGENKTAQSCISLTELQSSLFIERKLAVTSRNANETCRKHGTCHNVDKESAPKKRARVPSGSVASGCT